MKLKVSAPPAGGREFRYVGDAGAARSERRGCNAGSARRLDTEVAEKNLAPGSEGRGGKREMEEEVLVRVWMLSEGQRVRSELERVGVRMLEPSSAPG